MKKLTEAEWKKKLTSEQFRVLREKGTEPAFSGKLLENKQDGVYECGACGKALFSSHTKFESGSGWPSFYEPITKNVLDLKEDRSHGMQRVEAICKNCGSHLGHVFRDAPDQPTGLRFCINSTALQFEAE